MGIKTKFNPMGGRSDRDKGNLNLWQYSTNPDNGQITLEAYLGTDFDNTIYAPKAKGKTIFDYPSPFTNNSAFKSVDLQEVPFPDDDMHAAFNNCRNLIYVNGINQNITQMVDTFRNCKNLNYNVQIPPSITRTVTRTFQNCISLNHNIKFPDTVTKMAQTFEDCWSLNQNIQIPNSVTNMSKTFCNCLSLNQNIRIPNSVTDMNNTFASCYNLNQSIQIPNSVNFMSMTFYYCKNLNQNIQIPNSVTSMQGTFEYCNALNQNIQIPNSVDNLDSTFYRCNNLNQNIQIPSSVTTMLRTFGTCLNLTNVTILSANVANAIELFYGTTATKNIYFPLRYINNVNTLTRNSLVSAGYAVGTGRGNTSNNGTVWYDFVASTGFGTYTGNGTHWILNKWTHDGSAYNAPDHRITVPQSITSYDTFNTCLNAGTFQSNTVIKEVDCNYAPFAGTSSAEAFHGCTNLETVMKCNVPEGVTSVYRMFSNCEKLQCTSSNNYLVLGQAEAHIPNSVTNAVSLYQKCANISNFIVNGLGITTIGYAFDYCNTRALNITLKSPNIATITNCFRGNNKNYRKNVYIYFKYANGVATKTFNAFKATVYMGTSGNSTFANPSYNSTSNFYFYNLGTCPV